MRRLALILAAMLALAPAARAETQVSDPGDPFAWLDSMPDISADYEGTFLHLTEAIRQGRETGFPSPDWGILFAMLADFYRNDRGNAAYALRLTEEGLEVTAHWGPEADQIRSILNASRSYALADLGRYGEAAAAGRLSLPQYRIGLGDKAAEDYLATIREWEKGLPTEANTAPLDLARQVLVEAGQAVDRGDYGRGLMLASRAVLPEDSALDPVAVRRLAAEAGMISGRALFAMGRPEQALEVLRRASAAALDRGASDRQGHPVWRQEPGDGALRIASLYFWYGRAAMDRGLYDEAAWAYGVADAITTRPAMRFSLTMARVRLMQLRGDEAGSLTLLAQSAAEARARDDELDARRAEFYVATAQVRMAATPEALQALVAATGRVLDLSAGDTIEARADRAFYLTEAAYFLAGYQGFNATAVDYARRALAERRRLVLESRDSELGVEGQERETGSLVATYLEAAGAEAGAMPEAVCPDIDGMGCILIADTP